MKIYRGFPERLHHRVPHWIEPGALFHVRVALEREKEQKALTHPALAQEILDSAKFYGSQGAMAHYAFSLNARSFARDVIFRA
jgi:hypothetical protein